MSVSFGPAFFIRPSATPGVYGSYFGSGSLLTGWALPRSYASNQLYKAWPFCTRYNDYLLLPFPGSMSEFQFLNKILNEHQLRLPEVQRDVVLNALRNAELRLDLSHCPRMGEKLLIEGLKTPPGFEEPLFPFQEVAIRYIESLGFRALVGDDMGLGKTPIGIAAALHYKAKKVIVVTRAVALGAWQRAIKTWSDYACLTAQGTRPLKTRRKDGVITIPKGAATLNDGLRSFDAGVVLLNYELLTAWQEELLAFEADIVIFDEIHAVKEPKAARSQAAYALMGQCKAVIGLTGTPINNRPLELYHIVHNLQPGKWGEFFNFALRYCNAHRKVIGKDWSNCTMERRADGRMVRVPADKMAWDFSGSRLEKELYKRLRSNTMVRRLKDDVLDLLPAMEETLPLEPTQRYWKVEEGELAFIDGILSDNPQSKKKAEQSLHALFAAAALDKIDWAREWLASFLEDTDQKIVVFFHFQRVGEALHAMLEEWGIPHVNLWGTKPDAGGDHTFQTTPECRVALCSYSMAREAVTLTEAAYQLSMEYPWVPGWAEQARDRTRRIGQKRAVTYYYPILVGSAEERIVKAMLSKQDIISVITQGIHRKAIGIDASVLSVDDPDATAFNQ